MLLIVGLGNPGEKYKKTRHNSGFIVIDELRKKWNFPEFKFNKKFDSEISEKSYPLRRQAGKLPITSYKLLLIKPQTFMNRSGEAVRKIMDFYKAPRAYTRNIPRFFGGAKSAEAEENSSYPSMDSRLRSSAKADKLAPENIIVIHDDLDIEIGKYKISTDLSSAGHKGVQSIINNIGTQEFKRIRIGVEKAGGRKNRGNISGDSFVLQDFEEGEIEKVKNLAEKIEKEIK